MCGASQPVSIFNVSHDNDGVLYLRRGKRQAAADTFGTPEGHAVRLDADGQVIGITIVNAKWLLERDGNLTITVPSRIETNADEISQALAAA